MYAPDSRPWEITVFFELNGLPVIEELKRNWRAVAEEYDRFHRISDREEVPYPLPIYQGDWRLGAFRSSSVEYSYLPLGLQRETVWRRSPEHAGETDEATIHRLFIELTSQAMERTRTACPVLTGILDPLYPHACVMYSYSRMESGLELDTHCGADAGNVRVHFCLQEARDCSLTVLDQRRNWKAGEVWAFDDALPHSAEHHGDRDRVIVLIDLTKAYVETELEKLAPSSATRRGRLRRTARRASLHWTMMRSPLGRQVAFRRLKRRLQKLWW